MSNQFLQENTVGNRVKSFPKACLGRQHPQLSLIRWAGHFVAEGDQVSEAGPAFHKPMLAGPDPLAVPHMPRNGTQDDLLHDLPQHQGQADRPLVSWMLLPALLVDGCHIG